MLFIAFFAIVLSSCLQPTPPTVTFLEYKIAGLNSEGIEINFFFQSENPNPISVDIVGYSYKVYINDQEFLVDDRPGFTLQAKAKQLIKIPITISFNRLFGTALQIIQTLAKGDQSLTYKVEGTLKTSFIGAVFSTPIKASGTIPIPKDFKIQ